MNNIINLIKEDTRLQIELLKALWFIPVGLILIVLILALIEWMRGRK